MFLGHVISIRYLWKWITYLTLPPEEASSLDHLITSRFGNFWGAWHGKQGGKLHQIELNGRTIQKVTAYYTRWLNSIKIVLNDGSVFGPFGRKNGDKKVASFIPPSSGFLSFVKGASGDLVDRLELYFEGKFVVFI